MKTLSKTTIDWADVVWNPTVGCDFGCKYCYAEKLNHRYKFIPNWKEPVFFPDRLDFKKVTMPKARNHLAQKLSPDKPIIFVGSMSDIVQPKVKQEWINQIVNVIHQHQEANFYILTKRPELYRKLVSYYFMPKNIVFGTTITKLSEMSRYQFLCKIPSVTKFISLEPILSHFEGISFDGVDFIIIGKETGNQAKEIGATWVQSVKHHTIFFKSNLL